MCIRSSALNLTFCVLQTQTTIHSACGKCRKAGMRAVSPAALSVARKMLAERLDRFTENATSVGEHVARELTDVMLDVIEFQIDRKLMSRELLESLA